MPRMLSAPQPGYMAWPGFFARMACADVTMLYDAATVRGFLNRNRVLDCSGQAIWLTVPVRYHQGDLMSRTEIAESREWPGVHLSKLLRFYRDAQFKDEGLPILKEYYEKLEKEPATSLYDLAASNVKMLMNLMKIDCEVQMHPADLHEGNREEKLIGFCRRFECDRYLSSSHMKGKLDLALFDHAGIEVVWADMTGSDEPYAQCSSHEFVPKMSAIDLILNIGLQGSAQYVARMAIALGSACSV